MKQLFIVIIALSFSTASSAQIHAGIKGQYASTWLLNKNIFDAGDELDYKVSFGSSFGVHGIYMLGQQSGIGLGLGVSNINQQLESNFLDETIVFETALKYTDVGLFYTYIAEGGLYLEIGPQFSFRNEEVEETFDKDGDNQDIDTFTDPNMNNTTVFGVFGIGGLIELNDEIKLMVGLRLGYGFSDLTNELSQAEIDDLDSDVTSGHTQLAQYEASAEDPDLSYQSTNPAFAGFNLGVFYTFTK